MLSGLSSHGTRGLSSGRFAFYEIKLHKVIILAIKTVQFQWFPGHS